MRAARFAFCALVLTIAGDVGALSVPQQPRCERINAPMCQRLGYNNTRMPNFVRHFHQKDAISELQEFNGLLNLNCSAFLRLFVCSVYVPLCSEHVPGPVPPCRGLCEEVRKDCLPELQAAGFASLALLNCSSFPEPPDLCMQQPPEDEINHTRNELVPAYRNQELKQGNEIVTRFCPQNAAMVGRKCVKVCSSNIKSTEEERIILEVWIAVWSIITLAVVIFALLTFVIQPKRFRWPARPVLYLTTCGFVTCLMYFARWIGGSLNCSGEAQPAKPFESLICISLSLLLIYCDFAYALWWCTFSYVWYLSASKEWSTEAIEKISTRIHSIVWSLSVIPIVYALVSNNVTVNAYTGFCEVSSNVLTIAQLIIAATGVILAEFTSRALKDVRKALVLAGRSPYKLERLIYRIGIISLGISLPFCVNLICYYFTSLHIELLRISMKFLSILFSSFWVFSYKTFRTWNKILSYKGFRSAPVTKV